MTKIFIGLSSNSLLEIAGRLQELFCGHHNPWLHIHMHPLHVDIINGWMVPYTDIHAQEQLLLAIILRSRPTFSHNSYHNLNANATRSAGIVSRGSSHLQLILLPSHIGPFSLYIPLDTSKPIFQTLELILHSTRHEIGHFGEMFSPANLLASIEETKPNTIKANIHLEHKYTTTRNKHKN